MGVCPLSGTSLVLEKERTSFRFNESIPGIIKATGTRQVPPAEKLFMKKWIKTLTLGGMVALAAAACDDLGISPDTFDEAALRAEAALVAADGMFQDLSVAQDPGLQTTGFTGMGSGMSLAGGQSGQCMATLTTGTFDCPNMVRDGFTFTREVTFLDAEGIPQADGYDAATTDGIHMVMNSSGTMERSFWTATIERGRDMEIVGLLSTTHTMNGTGSGTIYRSGNPQEGLEKTFDMSSSATWTNVVHFLPITEFPYPQSGNVARHIVVTVTENGVAIESRDFETLITFNGTQFVTMLVDGEVFEIDLAERGVQGRFGQNHG